MIFLWFYKNVALSSARPSAQNITSTHQHPFVNFVLRVYGFRTFGVIRILGFHVARSLAKWGFIVRLFPFVCFVNVRAKLLFVLAQRMIFCLSFSTVPVYYDCTSIVLLLY